jgi:hypothetical protein
MNTLYYGNNLKILRDEKRRLEQRHLEKGICELEQIMVFHDWLEEHCGWDSPAAQQGAPADAERQRS